MENHPSSTPAYPRAVLRSGTYVPKHLLAPVGHLQLASAWAIAQGCPLQKLKKKLNGFLKQGASRTIPFPHNPAPQSHTLNHRTDLLQVRIQLHHARPQVRLTERKDHIVAGLRSER